ncbi:hypothetical protein O6H91_12G086400 [Diphasiastrum complanatum]|uniref:Uncharacterized protein n=1 Tax=Diphasiastrum complanatum TaxID=34168 RepID=A0ACC2C4G4_DIPCM|nr:hypothetical protein O6H91_Y094100 [Diphasiastrum complanatum]KAJ7536880.1 hypothetical protein O6H91_12G086400 [Diphasiastrum complanatum]
MGRGLIEALDEMVINGTISSLLAAKVHSKISFKGHLHAYSYCDSVWTFNLTNASVKTNNDDVQAVDHVKIVACDAPCIAKSWQL